MNPGLSLTLTFVTQLTIAADARWTNEASTNTVVRSQGYEATWTGGDPNGFAFVLGRTAGNAGMAVTCYERAGAGRLNVPAYIPRAYRISPTSVWAPELRRHDSAPPVWTLADSCSSTIERSPWLFADDAG
jgi:hypothetical protein